MKHLKIEKRVILILMTLCFFLVLNNTAQASDLSGIIMDAYTSVPLSGVTVQVKGTDTKVTTAQDGTYSMDLPRKAKTIILSHDGYQPLEIDIKGRDVINAVLTQAGPANKLWK